MATEFKNKIEATKEFWQPYYGKQTLSDSDALEILDTTTALISLFNDVVKKRQLVIEESEVSMG